MQRQGIPLELRRKNIKRKIAIRTIIFFKPLTPLLFLNYQQISKRFSFFKWRELRMVSECAFETTLLNFYALSKTYRSNVMKIKWWGDRVLRLGHTIWTFFFWMPRRYEPFKWTWHTTVYCTWKFDVFGNSTLFSLPGPWEELQSMLSWVYLPSNIESTWILSEGIPSNYVQHFSDIAKIVFIK